MLNNKIKNLRISFGISQTELANQLGVSKQCISNWENDNIQPSIDMLIKLADYFKVTTDFLLGLDGRRTIDVTGLSETEQAHITLLVNDLLKEKNFAIELRATAN
ncbi:MAG: helix-turn-helix domain-containing protein [Clostridia bacterium]|nr:helix-turn-helix domain-containing protein [Clostridia bacterium]